MAAGFGGGTALFIPFISWMIAYSGYQTGVHLHRFLQGVVIVLVAQFLGIRRRAVTAGAGWRGTSADASVHDDGDARRPQFYMMYANVRHDGDRRSARHGQRRTDGEVVGPQRRGADARRHIQPARQRRQPRSSGDGPRIASAVRTRWWWRSF